MIPAAFVQINSPDVLARALFSSACASQLCAASLPPSTLLPPTQVRPPELAPPARNGRPGSIPRRPTSPIFRSSQSSPTRPGPPSRAVALATLKGTQQQLQHHRARVMHAQPSLELSLQSSLSSIHEPGPDPLQPPPHQQGSPQIPHLLGLQSEHSLQHEGLFPRRRTNSSFDDVVPKQHASAQHHGALAGPFSGARAARALKLAGHGCRRAVADYTELGCLALLWECSCRLYGIAAGTEGTRGAS